VRIIPDMTAVPLVGRVEPSTPASPAARVAASTAVGVIVGGIAAAALRHAHDPVSAGMFLDLSRPEAVLMVLVGALVVGPVSRGPVVTWRHSGTPLPPSVWPRCQRCHPRYRTTLTRGAVDYDRASAVAFET
jgi:hypothetical protein